MTERPMWDAGSGEHPDEGTIHAWLDGALDADSAERVAAHVRDCATCSALVSEARGLIAGASRVVSALDDVPAGSRPGWAQSQVGGGGDVAAPTRDAAGMERSLWRRLRVTPTRAAIAATILVALGVTLTQQRVAMESVQVGTLPAGHLEPRSRAAGGAIGAAPERVPAPPKDVVLDSAVAKSLSIAQGSPRIEAAREPAIPRAPAPSAAPLEDAPVAMQEQRVAAGRAAAQAERDSSGAAADRLSVRSDASGGLMRRRAEVASTPPPRQGAITVAPGMGSAAAKVSQGYADAGAMSCYSLESQESGAMWGDQPLPLTVIVDSGPAVGIRNATVRSGATAMRAAWTRTGKDSVVVTLERIGMTGTIAFGPGAGLRAGMATSGATGATGMAAAAPRAEADARARSAKSNDAPSRAMNAAPLRVTLRPIDCPSR